MSWSSVVLLSVLTGVAWAWWWILRKPQRGRVRASVKMSHERWPEILHWEAGDKFDPHVDCCGKHYYGLRLIRLTLDGYAYCTESSFEERKVKVCIDSLIGHNESVITRQVDSELTQGDDYMQLVEQFNIAFKELQKRDSLNGLPK